MLSCQGSNLDSSDPESDVLPITLQDNFQTAKALLRNSIPDFRNKNAFTIS